MSMGMCSGQLLNNQHPTSSSNKEYAIIYYAGGSYYEYHKSVPLTQLLNVSSAALAAPAACVLPSVL